MNEAKELGDVLIIGLNSDESIKILKGKKRPINKLEYRIKQLEMLSIIDFIIVFNEKTPLNLIKILSFINDVSTTKIIKKHKYINYNQDY